MQSRGTVWRRWTGALRQTVASCGCVQGGGGRGCWGEAPPTTQWALTGHTGLCLIKGCGILWTQLSPSNYYLVHGECVYSAVVTIAWLLQAAGVREGDWILAVNGTDTRYLSHEQVVALIKASKDSIVLTLTTPHTCMQWLNQWYHVLSHCELCLAICVCIIILSGFPLATAWETISWPWYAYGI